MYPKCKIIPLKSGINEKSVPFISINWHESNLNFGNTGSLAQRERLWMCRAHCTRTTWYRMTFIKCRKSAQFIDYMFTWKFQFQVILNCENTCTGNPHGVLILWTVSAVVYPPSRSCNSFGRKKCVAWNLRAVHQMSTR